MIWFFVGMALGTTLLLNIFIVWLLWWYTKRTHREARRED